MQTSFDRFLAYQRTDYLNCSKDPRFFATWQSVAWICHVLLIPLLPMYVFTGYVILAKTPKAMGNTKWVIFNFYFWSCSMDTLLCSLITPFFFFPTLSGSTIGLLRHLGIPTHYQLYFGISALTILMFSMVFVFENRKNSLNFHGPKAKTWQRILFHLSNFVITAGACLPIYWNAPIDQNVIKLIILSMIPCPHEEFFSSQVFVVTVDPFWITYFVCNIIFLLFLVQGEIVYFMICCIYQLHQVRFSLSASSMKLQKTFLIGSFAQVIVPPCFYSIPSFIMAYVFVYGVYDQVINNLITITFSFHGIVATITMLLVHSPYRNFSIGLLFRKPEKIGPESSIVSKVFNQ